MPRGHLYQPADFLQPIGEDNRDEYLLVEFHRVLVNTNMSLLRNLMVAGAKDRELCEVLINLHNYAKLPIDEKYYATALYNFPEDLVYNLSKEKLSIQTCRDIVKQFREPYHFEYLHQTRISAMLRNLLDTKFVKNLYVYADKFSTEMLEYLRLMFGDKGLDTRVQAIEGSLVECLLAKPDITTCFVGNANDVLSVYDYGHELINKRLFMITQGYANMVPDPDKEGDFTLQHLETFQKWQEDQIATAVYMYPYCIEKGV